MSFTTLRWVEWRRSLTRARKRCNWNLKAWLSPIHSSKIKKHPISWTAALLPSWTAGAFLINSIDWWQTRTVKKMTFRVTIVLAFVIVGLVVAQAATIEERLEQINRMDDKARAEVLEKEARKEGEIIWYAAMASDRGAELIKGFESRYPFLKVRFQPGGAGRQLEQLLVEHRSKKHRAEIINTRRSYVNVMAKAGAIARYRTPLRSELREGFTDKEGLVNGIYAQPRVFLFNTRMVSRDKAPRSFDDLLDPQWKDKMGLDTTDYDWLA